MAGKIEGKVNNKNQNEIIDENIKYVFFFKKCKISTNVCKYAP